jgi:hypothetical protein
VPKLKADFEADWVAHMRAELAAQGWPAGEVARLDDRDVRYQYLEAQRRRIVATPRTLQLSQKFNCPADLETGWQALQGKIRNGEDLNPHLSKAHASLFNQDGLLAEWGVHHFHLGVAADRKQPAYVERTGPLVYALVTPMLFCAINMYHHGRFEDSSVLEIIHCNWPDLIHRYRVKDVTAGNWSETDRRAFRSKNANVCSATADGTVYMPISGGVMASGVTLEAVRQGDYEQDRIRGIQASFEEKLPEILKTLAEHGYAGEDEIEAQLRISDEHLHIFLPKYNVLALLAMA